ncbi:hypothetical protein [Megasphaera sp.]|uniref:hypothetical protein n=1 Tax=Megasphaera sp. TaxID=2023260 RepID=UPI0025BDC601|nr:hypothetical protein [Megasphaera sp.]MCF0154111.1 hypothetical protein [Megasphaera sp.]MCF0257941.1 hypothetical protein [Bacteroides heparinolyticus]
MGFIILAVISFFVAGAFSKNMVVIGSSPFAGCSAFLTVWGVTMFILNLLIGMIFGVSLL